ncbi:MAG: metal-dependent hydrolase [Acidiferrobacterales bacterium]
MATIISHPAVPLAIGLASGRRVISPRLLVVGVVCSVIPDLDVVAFHFDVPYAHQFGHRGFTHSILFAVLVGLAGVGFHRWLQAQRHTVFLFLFASTVSHGILDAMTTGGLGIAFLWPYEQRYFLPWQFIQVSPIGFSRFFSAWGAEVLKAEFIWIWLPTLIVGIFGLVARTIRANTCEQARH